jgi:hypothetical protein
MYETTQWLLSGNQFFIWTCCSPPTIGHATAVNVP